MDEAAAREAVSNELGAALPPFGDEDRIVVGDRLVQRQRRGDPVLVQQIEDPENADPVAVFVVAPAADIGKLRLVAGPQPSGPPIGLMATGVPGGTSQSQCSRLTMTASATRAAPGQRSGGRAKIGDHG